MLSYALLIHCANTSVVQFNGFNEPKRKRTKSIMDYIAGAAMAAAATAIGASVVLYMSGARVCVCVCVGCEYNKRHSIIHGLWFFLNKIRFLSVFCLYSGLIFLIDIKSPIPGFWCVLAIFTDIDQLFDPYLCTNDNHNVSSNVVSKNHWKTQGLNFPFQKYFAKQRRLAESHRNMLQKIL